MANTCSCLSQVQDLYTVQTTQIICHIKEKVMLFAMGYRAVSFDHELNERKAEKNTHRASHYCCSKAYSKMIFISVHHSACD